MHRATQQPTVDRQVAIWSVKVCFLAECVTCGESQHCVVAFPYFHSGDETDFSVEEGTTTDEVARTPSRYLQVVVCGYVLKHGTSGQLKLANLHRE